MSAFYRDIKHLSSQHVGGADAAGDNGGSGSVDSRVRRLGAAQTEFHDAVALGGVNDPGRLGGDQALVVDDV